MGNCVYTSANAAAAGIVHETAHWKGFNSMRMPYGKEYVITKSHIGLWSKQTRCSVAGDARPNRGD